VCTRERKGASPERRQLALQKTICVCVSVRESVCVRVCTCESAKGPPLNADSLPYKKTIRVYARVLCV